MKIIGICGYSGSGKTTLLKKLIPQLKSHNIRLAVIKHSHHDMDIDIPGKDSYQLRKSGADQVIVANDHRWALINETPTKAVDLMYLANQFNNVDLVLVEGFKNESIDKISCYRQDVNKPLYYDNRTIAIVSDIKLNIDISSFDINDIDAITCFIKQYLSKP